MLVTTKNLAEVPCLFSSATHIGFDTETYGLGWGDKAFMLGFWLGDRGLCFDLRQTPMVQVRPYLEPFFKDKHKTWFIHNAKFDLHKLALEGITIEGTVHCTMAIASVLHNNHFSYSLDNCLKRDLKRDKNDQVKKWILENGAYTVSEEKHKKKKTKNLHYDKVPNDILVPYQIDDARDVYDLGMYQLDRIASEPVPDKWAQPFYNLIENEKKLTKVCFEIEQTGIKLDIPYTEKCMLITEQRIKETHDKISDLAGEPYVSGPKWLAGIFTKFGVRYQINPKTNNPCFDKHHMEAIDHPIAKKIVELRHHENYLRNFYSTFLAKADSKGCVHPNIWQSGTATGRFSYSEPNFQNIPKEEDFKEDPIVRRCFVPRKGYKFVAIDYDQQEFRLMLDYAGEQELIKRIVEDGIDVHQATADMVGISRKEAKTLNFGLLYGMGVDTLAVALGLNLHKSEELRRRYFAKMPKVQKLSQRIISKGEVMRHVYNWAGRKLRIDDRRFAYKLPNHVIQGGGGDIMRIAMVQIQEKLRPHKSKILATIHDELLFEVHESEMELIQMFLSVMENVYTPQNGMKLTCGVSISDRSFAQIDMEEL